MKTVGRIFLRDVKALGRNPVALFVVLALLVLPGLYAWYCIIANWDPYSHTGRVPIAIVNEDKGATSKMTGDVNIGEQVTEKLADNDDIDWRFYDDKEEALEDTRTGVCYATFVFPEDLSENVVGIFEGSDKTPTLYYYPNEKRNAVATKVTDSAAQNLIIQINQEFSSTVNETLLTTVQEGAKDAEAEADKTRNSALDDIADAQADLKKTIALLDDAANSVTEWRGSVAEIQETLTQISAQLPEIRSSLSKSSGDLDTLRVKVIEFDSTFSQTLAQTNLTLANLSLRVSTDVGNAASDVAKANASLNETIEQIKVMIEIHGGLESVKELLEQALTDLENASARLNESVQRANKTVQDMNASTQEMIDATNAASQSFSKEALPQLLNGTYELTRALAGLESAIAQFEPQITELKGVLAETDAALAEAQDAIAQTKKLLQDVDANLGSTMTDLGALRNALQVNEIAELLDVDPENLGAFVSSPAQMVTENIYPVSNYGTAVTPFYTCLALWVGCFILLSVMKLEIDSRGFEEATAVQRYFGRLSLLMVLALIQSQVICGVDILLGIDCANPAAFMAAGAICSFVFMNLLYALVITFRNIGKTLCIVLLIMQVPGSSGMYPIELMPNFFRGIHPLLPFTYSIDAMREALCGMQGADYFIDLFILLGVVIVALAVALIIRPHSLNLAYLFDNELRKAGFFEGERYAQKGQDEQIVILFHAMARNRAFRGDVEERARVFRRRYPIVRRAGSIALVVIPFALLIIMLPLNLLFDVSTDTKLNVLAFSLIVLLIVQFGLILLEYANHTIGTEKKLLSLDTDAGTNAGEGFSYETLVDEADHARLEIEHELPLPINITSGASRNIFHTDMKLGFHSVIGLVVIMLLVITPSLYAWFNLAGSWDPYSNTGNLKVAVANNDEGYKGDLIPMTINVGDTIAAQLRGEPKFDWVFVSEEEAIEGVYNEDYYAAIVIPSDFSRNMMTYLLEDADYPKITYYTNEKANPIAPIITQKGADAIQEGIRTAFTQQVDEVGLTIAADLTGYVTKPELSGYADKMGLHIDNATRDLRDGASAMRTLASLSRTASNVVSTASVALEGINATSAVARSALDTAKEGAENASNAFALSAQIVEEALSGSSGSLDRIAADVDASLADMEENVQNVPAVLHTSAAALEEATEIVREIARLTRKAAEIEPDEKIKEELLADAARYDGIATSMGNLADAVRSAADHSDSLTSNIEATRAEIKELVVDADAAIASTQSFYHDAIKTSAEDIEAAMKSASNAIGAIMDSIEAAVGGLSGSADGLIRQLDALSEELTETAGKLDKAAANISNTKKKLTDALASGDVKQLEDVILGADTSAMAMRLATPLEECREPLYPVENFGSSMASFYTVLSLWVGALVLVSTLQLHVAEERMEQLRRRYPRIRAFSEYAGRFGIFSFISLLQSILVLLGDLCLLHIQCVHPLLFMLFGVFIGQVFCLFVYTLSELFGDVGKALCVILLIMQVAASGGTFPVEMLDPMLSDLVPFLPFYHGMNLLKECVAGIYWPSVGGNVAFLLAMVVFVLLIGVVARRPFRKLNDWFEGQLHKTGFM